MGSVGERVRRIKVSKEFHRLIRQYNNAFAFCFLGAEVDRRLAQQLTGTYTFRAHDQLYH